jgi:hypothetical protein
VSHIDDDTTLANAYLTMLVLIFVVVIAVAVMVDIVDN